MPTSRQSSGVPRNTPQALPQVIEQLEFLAGFGYAQDPLRQIEIDRTEDPAQGHTASHPRSAPRAAPRVSTRHHAAGPSSVRTPSPCRAPSPHLDGTQMRRSGFSDALSFRPSWGIWSPLEVRAALRSWMCRLVKRVMSEPYFCIRKAFNLAGEAEDLGAD